VLLGTLDGTGTLTAGEYDLNGATVNANLGGGGLYQLGGTSTLNGTTGVVTANIQAGMLTLGGNERLADGSTVLLNSGAALNLAGHSETLAQLFGTGGSVHLGTGGSLTLGYGNATSGFGGVIDGSGSLYKVGTGTLTLAGNNTFSGTTFVNGGGLDLLGRLAGGVTVNTGGTLTGSGLIGGTLTLNGGTLSPGGAGLGLLTAGGFNSTTGTYVVDVTGAPGGFLSDGLRVNGAAALTGGTVQVRLSGSASDYTFDQRYLIVGANSLTGTFANPNGFTASALDPNLLTRLRYDLVPGGVVLEVRRLIDWTQGAEPGNSLALAGALNGTQHDASDSWAGTLNLLAGLSSADRARAFQTMSGEGSADASTAALLVGDRFMSVMQNRMGGSTGVSMPDSFMGLALNGSHGGQMQGLLGAADPLNAADQGERSGAESWMEAYAVDSKLMGRGGASDVGTGGAGIAAGWEGTLGRNGRVGGALGFSKADADVDALESKAKGEFWHAGSYAVWNVADWRFGVAATHMRGDLDTSRLIVLGGGGVQAEGETKISATTLSVEGARRFALGGGFDLTALGRATGTDLRQDAYVERGAGGLSLAVDEVERQLYVGQLGVQLKRTFKGEGVVVEPYVGAGMAFAGGDREGAADVAFTGAPTGTGAFTVVGAALPPSWGEVNAGVQLRSGEGFAVKLGYDGAYSDRMNESRFAVRVGWKW
jgi:autotransporter-associated beta strand protein